jgi:hypothetical protein
MNLEEILNFYIYENLKMNILVVIEIEIICFL